MVFLSLALFVTSAAGFVYMDLQGQIKRFDISDYLDGTILQAYRFEADSVCTDGDPSICSWVRIFGKKGVCMQLAVDDPEYEGVGI